MRGVLAAAAAALAIAAFPVTAAAAPPDTTTGTGTRAFIAGQSQQVHVNAKSEEGLNPRGHAFIDQVGISPAFTFKVHGDVTCHRVVGNAAVVGVALREPVLAPLGGREGVLIFINDDGEPGAGQDDVTLSFSSVPPTVCPPPSQFEGPIEQGNYTVHDR